MPLRQLAAPKNVLIQNDGKECSRRHKHSLTNLNSVLLRLARPNDGEGGNKSDIHRYFSRFQVSSISDEVS